MYINNLSVDFSCWLHNLEGIFKSFFITKFNFRNYYNTREIILLMKALFLLFVCRKKLKIYAITGPCTAVGLRVHL